MGHSPVEPARTISEEIQRNEGSTLQALGSIRSLSSELGKGPGRGR